MSYLYNNWLTLTEVVAAKTKIKVILTVREQETLLCHYEENSWYEKCKHIEFLS